MLQNIINTENYPICTLHHMYNASYNTANTIRYFYSEVQDILRGIDKQIPDNGKIIYVKSK